MEQAREHFAQQRGGKRPKRGHKYNAEPTVVDGIRFPSKLQAKHYGTVRMMLAGKLISGYEMEVTFPINAGPDIKMSYRADWVLYYPDGRKVIVDSKGYETREFKQKWKAMKSQYPEYEFETWR